MTKRSGPKVPPLVARASACSGGFSHRQTQIIPRHFTLEYWPDDGWYMVRLKEIPGVVSQGETPVDSEENIRDAYQLVTEDAQELLPSEIQTKQIRAEA